MEIEGDSSLALEEPSAFSEASVTSTISSSSAKIFRKISSFTASPAQTIDIKLDINNLRLLKAEFEREDPGNQGFTKQRFAQVVSSFHKDTNHQLWEVIYDFFDIDKDGFLTFREFACGYAVLCGGESARLRFLFNMIDTDGDNGVCREEFEKALSLMKSYSEVIEDYQIRDTLDRVDLSDFFPDDKCLLTFERFQDIYASLHVFQDWLASVSYVAGGYLEKLRQQKEEQLLRTEMERMGIMDDFHIGDVKTHILVASHAEEDDIQFIIDYETIIFDKLLGSGTFGNVWKAEWLQLPVAVKIFKRSEDEDLRQGGADIGFMHEIKILTKLRHPNVLLFMGATVDKSKPCCIVTELYQGGTLESVIHNEIDPPTIRKILELLIQAARGMNYLHKLNILHRDLKTDNILVDENLGHAVISDFGLSRLANAFYTTYMPAGTAAFSSPEVLDNGEYTDKCDVYSFGIILWQALSRQHPYEGLSLMEIMMHTIEGDRLAFPEESLIPSELKSLIEACWHQDPSKRPMFSEILDVLQHSLEDVETSSNTFSHAIELIFDNNLSALSKMPTDTLCAKEETYDGKSLLHIACMTGNLQIVKFLLASGVNKFAVDRFGHSCIYYAFRERHYEICEHLRQSGVEYDVLVESTVRKELSIELIYNIGSGDLTNVLRLINCGADVNYQDYEGRTALHVAASREYDPDMIECLISAGANPLAEDRHGNTPEEDALKYTGRKL